MRREPLVIVGRSPTADVLGVMHVPVSVVVDAVPARARGGRATIVAHARVGGGAVGASSRPHWDSIEMDGGGLENIVIEGNRHVNDMDDTSMLMLDNWSGDRASITVRRNLLTNEGASSRPGFTMYCDGDFAGAAPMRDHAYVSNVLGRGAYGYLLARGTCDGLVFAANVEEATHAIVTDPRQDDPPACNDGIDNDGDGQTDFGPSAWNDPDCATPVGAAEN